MVTTMSSGRDAMGLSFMGDRLFIVGGFDGQSYLNSVEAYDPLTNEWQQVFIVFLPPSLICRLIFFLFNYFKHSNQLVKWMLVYSIH